MNMINNKAFLCSKKKKKKAKQNKKRQNRTTVCDNRLIDLELAHTMKSHFN